MKLIIQENGLGIDEFDQFMTVINELNLDYQIVKVIPFSHDMLPEVQDTGQTVIPFGTIFLSKIGEERGWNIFHNDMFDQRIWTDKYKGYMLNDDATYYKLKDLPEDLENEVFLRPVLDWKLFTGHIRLGNDIKRWKTGFAGDGWDSDMVWADALEQWVSVSSVKNIKAELRFAVVKGKVVTGSYYRINGERELKRVQEQELYEWIQNMINLWKPLDTFVIDVAIMPNGERKIIELGTINACGLYDMDVKKILESIIN